MTKKKKSILQMFLSNIYTFCLSRTNIIVYRAVVTVMYFCYPSRISSSRKVMH